MDEEVLNKVFYVDLSEFNFDFYCDVDYATDVTYRRRQLKKFRNPHPINEDIMKIQFMKRGNILTERYSCQFS